MLGPLPTGLSGRGQGTPTIEVDSTGLGGRTIDAELDVNDDVYDNKCRQAITVPPVPVDKLPPPPQAFVCDEFHLEIRR